MKVLVIEDNAGNVDLLSTRLRNLDCAPLIALNAEDALAIAANDDPDLILLDLKLDHSTASGLAILSQLRANPRTAHIPVIIHSISVMGPGDLPQAEVLADELLLKPFKFDDLRKVIAGFRLGSSSATEGVA